MFGCEDKIGCLSGKVTRVGESLKGSLTKLGESLCGSVSLICTISSDFYLEVTPDVIWLDPNTLESWFEVRSNVEWQIYKEE